MLHMVPNQYRMTPDEPSNGQKPAAASFSPLWLRGQEHVGLFYIEPPLCLSGHQIQKAEKNLLIG